jgi:hypothetical protein
VVSVRNAKTIPTLRQTEDKPLVMKNTRLPARDQAHWLGVMRIEGGYTLISCLTDVDKLLPLRRDGISLYFLKCMGKGTSNGGNLTQMIALKDGGYSVRRARGLG